MTITGRIEQPRDKDTFRFTAKAGETINIRVESRSLGYPLDPVSGSIRRAKARCCRASTMQGRAAMPNLPSPCRPTANIRVAVSDLHRQGGQHFIYRLTATIAQPDFALSLGGDTFAVAAGQKLELPVTVERLQGFKEPIQPARRRIARRRHRRARGFTGRGGIGQER